MGCGSAGYAVDSATSACRQNPAYCAQVAGEEAVVPTLRSVTGETVVPVVRGAFEVASVGATLRVVLNATTKSRIEQALMECADWAHEKVDSRYFRDTGPTREQCKEELPQLDPCGRKVTRAMHLGTEKHALALQCAEQKLGALIPGRFSLEQRYRYDSQSQRTELATRSWSRPSMTSSSPAPSRTSPPGDATSGDTPTVVHPRARCIPRPCKRNQRSWPLVGEYTRESLHE
jgi:hypothetical protein